MSAFDSLAVAPMGAVGAVTLGLSAAGSTTNDILSRGGDNYQAFWGGVAAGVFEGFFEKFSIGQLNSMKEGVVSGFKDCAKNLVKSMGVNFSEEAATEVANIIYDYAMNGGISNYSIMVQDFIDNGDSLEVAKKKAAAKLGLQVLEAGASGALMGFGFASMSSAASYKKTSSIGKVIAANESESEIINAALSMGVKSKSHKLATEIQQSDKMTTAKIGGLAVQVMSDISEQKATVIGTAVEERAQELGVEFKITQKLTNYLTQVATNSKIETANAEDIGKNTKAQQIITEIKNGEVWAKGMNVQLSLLEKAETVVRNAITFNSTHNSSVIVDENSNIEVESQMVDAPDTDLLIEQRAENQNVIDSVEDNTNTSLDFDTSKSKIDILAISKRNNQRRHTTAKEQTFIKRIADKIGVKVVFEHITPELLRSYGYEFNEGDILPDGYYDRNTGTIHMGYTVYNPVSFILKHELTHFGEGTAQYEKFVKAVKKSKTFKNWLGKETGYRETNNLEDAYLLKIAKVRGFALDKNGELSAEDRKELHCEMIADFVGECIFTDNTTMLEDMLSNLSYEERRTVIEYIRDFISYIKKKLLGEREINFEISRLEDMFNHMLSEAVDTKKETPTESGGDLQFSHINESIDTSIKQQLNENSNLLNSMDIVASLDENKMFESKQQVATWILNQFEKIGYKVNRRGFGEVVLDKKRIKKGLTYLKTNEERLAFALVPQVLCDGIEIAVHSKHKGRNYNTVTFAAPVEINGQRGNMAVVVRQEDKNYYKVHRLLMPDGSQFIFEEKRDISETAGGVNKNSGLSPTDNVSNNSITNISSTVNNNSKNKLQFSFVKVQDDSLIKEAERMEKQLQNMNYSSDEIRSEIWISKGIMRDTSGKWVYEIEDRSMKFFPLGNAKKDTATDDNGSVYRKGKVEDFIKHPKLFKVFPIIRSMYFEICDFKDDRLGEFDSSKYTIRISAKKVLEANKKLKELGGKMPRDAWESPYREVKGIIAHEIQHVLQRLENREPGSSVEYWNMRFERDGKLPIDKRTGEQHTLETAYWYTKGEYEARETGKRVPISPKYRQFIIPDLGHDITISAKEKVGRTNLKFSIPTDAEYMAAIQDGDTEQLKEMVDNVAASKGYTERLYHQTGAEFTEFNTENQVAGKFDWQLPTGIFLKPSDNDIGLKGKKQMGLFAKTENPLRFTNRSEAQEFWSERVPKYKEAAKKVSAIDEKYQSKHDEAIAKSRSYLKKWRAENPDTDSREIYKDSEYLRLNDIEDSIADEWEAESDKASIEAKKLINDFITNSEYDGVVIELDQGAGNRQTKSYIVFDSAQLKSAAPITYDDNGKVVPLSDRFNKDEKDIRFSVPSLQEVDSYTEEQYNDFGWVRANNVLSSAEYETLLSRYADYKHNKDKYPTTRFGEAVIFSFDHIGVVMYVKGSIETPEITKVIRMSSDIPLEIQSDIQKEIVDNERKGVLLSWEDVTSIFGEGVFIINKKRNFESFQEYERGRKRGFSQNNSSDNRTEQNRTGSQEQNNAISKAGLKKPAFSMPSETAELLEMSESGEITKSQYKAAMDKYWDDMPLGERIAAGVKYLKLGGNGDVKKFLINELHINDIQKD